MVVVSADEKENLKVEEAIMVSLVYEDCLLRVTVEETFFKETCQTFIKISIYCSGARTITKHYSSSTVSNKFSLLRMKKFNKKAKQKKSGQLIW